MKKIAVLLIICLTLSALAGCARANERGEEIATLTQPEQIIEKDEVAKKEEPADIDSADELEEEPQVSEQPQIQEQPKEEPIQKEPETPQTNEKKDVVRSSVPEGSQFDLSSLPRVADGCVGLLNLVSDNITLERLRAKLDPSQSIVFRGKVNGKSTQYRRNGSGRQYNETPVLVQEVYYGDLKVGDVVNCYENMFVHLHDGEPVLEYYSVWPPLEKDEEYLFILRDGEPMREGGDDVYYVGHSYEPYIRISELGTLQSKKELSKKEQRNLDALTYYYLGQRGESAE